MNYTELEQQVLQLPYFERTDLTQKLLLSLDKLNDAEYERSCLEEAVRRAQEIEDGKVIGLSGEQVFERLRQNLKNFK